MSLDSNLDVEHFDDDSSRVCAFDLFKKERDIWIARQMKINVTRRLFNDLHLTYIDLERDSEVIELMIGQGMMLCEMSEYNKINHPILLKKVTMEFDSLHNIIKIVDTEYSPEIYTMLLQGIDFINHSAVKIIKEQLSQDLYHPLDRNDTPDFLKSLTHRLHSESSYIENINDDPNSEDKLIVINNPVFFVRKRTGGVVKAIEEIISELEETGKLSGPLLNLIGGDIPQFGEKEEILDANYSTDMNHSLSSLSGEDKDILLSKEANREQLEIAKRIENYNAVLVQGPPGTGKTHTIANLMGHFLAQGKNILVTSHTKKALSVVKEKVAPELQDLCVSVLDDNSRDMERSIDGITEYISSHSSLELLENIDVLVQRREKISTDLDDVRKNIFSVKYKEFETIVFGGESLSPAAAAKYVCEHSESLSSIIPGKVLLGKPFPITSSDLALIYKTNTAVSLNDEQELSVDLPEQIAVSHVQKIKMCANWYNTTYEEIKQTIYEAKLNDSILSEKQDYITALDEITQLIQVLYTDIPKFIEIAVNVYDKLFSINNKFEKIQSVFNAKQSESSAVCQNIMSAIVLKNVELYKNFYNELTALHQKYHYSNERKRILEQIRNYAPDWAELLNNRVGIHGEGIEPENIEEAWKWKQLAGAVDQITALPFEALQHKSVSLADELRTATAQLAEKLAWQHLLARIEKDISQKQALQGWKLTVKKIGKGTGKAAPALRREAQKLMARCQTAVPAWIMPINKALESLDPKTNKFDIVIIDEASQSDISALAIIYLAKKIIIVGDDEQVSPSAVGIDVDKMANLANMFIKGIIPNAHLYDMKSSLYDIAKTTFPTLMLKEHFRCVPDIIGYNNRLSYDYKIKPLRDESNVAIKPATISYRVKDGIRSGRRKVNQKEAKAVVALMLACMEFREYNGMTFGAISLLGDEQAKYIQALALEKISPLDYEKRRILCGDASHFQGDERDVIFISLVDNNEGEAPLRLTGEGVGKSTKQRYNVAVSRAKNQLWVVHSLDVSSDLKSGDMRRDLIEYVTNPTALEEQTRLITAKADSPFEVSVAKALVFKGYHIVQQWKVGAYSIDMVALFGDKKIAIECDGELYHSGDEKILQDMERQTILERLGWRFIRIRGSEYYRDQESTIKRVICELEIYGIEPESKSVITEDYSKLKNDVIIRAEQMIQEWHHEEENSEEKL